MKIRENYGTIIEDTRGWSDLSDMIRLYEENGIEVDEKLIAQIDELDLGD